MYETSNAVAAATAILESKHSNGNDPLLGASPAKPRVHSTTMAKRS